MSQRSLSERIVGVERKLIELPGKAVGFVLVIFYAIREFNRDLGLDRAATLSFASLLSIIPLAVLFFSFAGQLGGGQELITFAEEKVFSFIAPEFHDDLSGWMQDNLSKSAFAAGKTGLINYSAIVALLIAAVGLLNSAERIFNRIWKAKGKRTYLRKLAAFWIILTTSPFLIALSMSINRFVLSDEGRLQSWIEKSKWVATIYESIIPFLVAFLGITTLYLFLPATRVKLKSAALGGFVAALLWSLSKGGFYLYVQNATTAQTFYGKLATVPLFLVWIYISWVIILYGAEVSYAHQNLRGLRRAGGKKVLERSRLYIGLELLTRVRRAMLSSEVPDTTLEMALDLGVRHEDVEDVARRLVEERYLTEDGDEEGRFVLARSAEQIPLSQVAQLLLGDEFSGEVLDVDARGARPVSPSRGADLAQRAWKAAPDTFGEETLASAMPA